MLPPSDSLFGSKKPIYGYHTTKQAHTQSKIRKANLCKLYTVILHKIHLLFFIPANTVFVTVLILSFFIYAIIRTDTVQ